MQYKTSQDYDRLWELSENSDIIVIFSNFVGIIRKPADSTREFIFGHEVIFATSLKNPITDFKNKCLAYNLYFIDPADYCGKDNEMPKIGDPDSAKKTLEIIGEIINRKEGAE